MERIVIVHSNQWCNSLNWIQLNDADVFHSFSDFDSDSRPHFRPESFQRFIYFNKIQHFLLMERIVIVHSNQWCNSLNWIQLNDADGFLQFPILILNLDLISVPNHSKGSYILIKFNTFSSWREIVSVHSSQWFNSHYWIQLNDAYGFLQFPNLIRILERTSVPKHTRDSFILIKFNTFSSWREIVRTIRVSGVIHLIGYTLMMQMFFIHFPILIRILDLISVPNHSRDSFI